MSSITTVPNLSANYPFPFYFKVDQPNGHWENSWPGAWWYHACYRYSRPRECAYENRKSQRASRANLLSSKLLSSLSLHQRIRIIIFVLFAYTNNLTSHACIKAFCRVHESMARCSTLFRLQGSVFYNMYSLCFMVLYHYHMDNIHIIYSVKL